MARTQHGDSGDGLAGAPSATHHHLDANAQGTMTLPGNEFVTDSQMLRDGQDLVLRAPGGDTVTIENYFAVEPAPTLISSGGAALTPDLVDSFSTPIDGVQYAQKGSVDDESPVGIVKESGGESLITHANGVVETISVGTPVYAGDIIETKGDGAVNITFIDETTFAVSENARLAIDEYVFDPASMSGESNFSVLRGVFVFTSGLIGREDPDDVKIDTPVGSIGIRGTTIMGTINPDGQSHITVVEGAIVVTNGNGEQTLSQQFETVKLAGFNDAMAYEGVIDANVISESYNVLRAVSAPLFSTIDQAGEKSGDTQDAAPAGDAPAPADADKKSDATDPNAPQTTEEALANPLGDDLGLSLDSGFDTSAGLVTADNLIANTSANSAPISTTTAESGSFNTTAPAAFNATMATAEPVIPPNLLTPVSGGGTTTNPGTTTPTTGIDLNAIITGAGAAGITYIPSVAAGSQHGIAVTSVGNGANGAPLYAFLNINGQLFIDNGSGNLYNPNLTATPYNLVATDMSLAGVGDFNGDGNVDLAVGSPTAGASNNGIIQVITNFASGAHSTISGFGPGALSGTSISGIGDFNGDGRSDLLIGAPDPTDTGRAYVVFGQAATSISATGLTDGFGGTLPAAGFSIVGAAGVEIGHDVAGLGDFDGDGFSDFAISSPLLDDANNTGSVKVFYGQGSNAALNTGSFMTITGIGVIDGDESIPVIGMGDFNGDGYSDLGIAEVDATTNTLHIFYGSAARQNGSYDISTSDIKLTSTNTLIGGGSAGDFNGDGLDDIVVATMNGTNVNIYVIYGGAGSGIIENFADNDQFHMTVDLVAAGFGLTLPVASELDFNFTNAGDLNGDGLDDIVMGIADINNDAGGVLLVMGRAEAADIANGSILNANAATANNQTLLGTAGSDTMTTGAWTGSLIKSGAGIDTINVVNGTLRGLDGGAGSDTANFLSGANIDLRSMGDRLTNIEQINLDNAANTTLTIGIDDIFRLLQESDGNTLTFGTTQGGAGDVLRIDNNGRNDNFDGTGVGGDSLQDMGFAALGTSGQFNTWTFGGYTLFIDQSLAINVTNVV